MVRTRLKLAATLTVVVLALTGFHTGKGGHGSGGGSGKSKSGKSRSHSGSDDDDSGGGCSSDEQGNDDYDGAGSSSGGETTYYTPAPTSTPTADVSVSVVDCVDPARRKSKGRPARKADLTATVKVISNAEVEKTFRIVMVFKGADGGAVDQVSTDVTVGRREVKTVEVEMARPENVGRVKECWAYDMGVEAGPSASTPTPSVTSS